MKISFILLSLVLFSCDNNNTGPIDSKVIVNPEDVALKQNIIGSWEMGSTYSITFKDNGTYLDSSWTDTVLFDPGDIKPNICSSVKKGNLFLNKATSGNYTISDGVLNKQPVSYNVQCNPLKAPANYGYSSMIIKFKDDTLKLQEVKIWEKVSGQSQDIWNSWVRHWWSWSFHKDLPLNGSAIYLKETVKFIADSTLYFHTIEGLPYDNVEHQRPFEYKSSVLYGKDDYSFYVVSYSNGKMFWLNNKFTYNYKRNQ